MGHEKIIIIVGPTASGKSELAVQIAQQVDGEIISADSRQIYRGLDIGSGKVQGKWRGGVFRYKKIPHYLIDEVSPRGQYSVAKFQKKAQKIIADILKRDKTPIICGGTAHWVDAIVFGQALPEVKPNAALRAKLSQLTTTELFKKLQKLDPNRAATIDAKNPRRLIRALEIVLSTGKPVPQLPPPFQEGASTEWLKNVLWLGINPAQEGLHQKIAKRLKARLQNGMIEEVTQLHASGLSWKKLESFGLEYKFCALYLQKKISEKELEQQLLTAIKQYAKRQMTWWKRNKNIHWSDKPSNLSTLAKAFVK